MLLPQFIREGAAALEALYPPQEARSLVLRLCEDLCGFKSYDYIVRPELEAPEELVAGLGRLLAGEPLQHVTGWQEFCGRRFRVGPSVLIPRPESEQLVRLAEARKPASVLDLCTGSGCIAWTLALDLPGCRVVGVDISEEALAIARAQFDGGPDFLQADVLAPPMPDLEPFDVLTANPPYIRESEKARMHRNVLEHEPELALFVPDDDPLVFYRAVANWAQRLLKPGGWGIVEINEELGDQTAAVFSAAGMEKVEKEADFLGKDRFVSFEKPL